MLKTEKKEALKRDDPHKWDEVKEYHARWIFQQLDVSGMETDDVREVLQRVLTMYEEAGEGRAKIHHQP
jgi:hypothetical protein